MRKSVVKKMMLGLAVTGVAAAPILAATAGEVIKNRIAQLRELGTQFKNVNDELKSGSPNAMIIQISARQMRDVARDQYQWFPKGSGPEAGMKTKAKPEIWAKPAEFKAAQDNFAKQANAFFQVASSGDPAKMRAQARLLGQACSGCHRGFRAEDS